MYLDHFGLTETPFGITPDTSFAYSTRSHDEALNTLKVALAGGEGFTKITGEVGTGKTLLCRRLLAELGPQDVSAYLPHPRLDPRTLYLALADELGLSLARNADDYRILRRLDAALLRYANGGRRVVLCIDEAQALPLESLEALRLLSNLETEKRKLLHVVLFGQPELDARLRDRSVRQLRQRITFSYRLRGLTAGELGPYLSHRLGVAGNRNTAIFAPRAVRALHRASGGIPRLVNILAHKAMMLVFGSGGRRVEASHVRAAAADDRLGLVPVWQRGVATLRSMVYGGGAGRLP